MLLVWHLGVFSLVYFGGLLVEIVRLNLSQFKIEVTMNKKEGKSQMNEVQRSCTARQTAVKVLKETTIHTTLHHMTHSLLHL